MNIFHSLIIITDVIIITVHKFPTYVFIYDEKRPLSQAISIHVVCRVVYGSVNCKLSGSNPRLAEWCHGWAPEQGLYLSSAPVTSDPASSNMWDKGTC